MAPPYLSDLKQPGGRRTYDYEAAAKALAGKAAPSCPPTTSASGGTPAVASGASHSAGAMVMNGWQESAIDLTKTSGEISTTSGEAAVASGLAHHGAGDGQQLPPPPITAPLAGCVGIDMAGILQAGLIHPVTGQIINGTLRGDDSLRRRRGRRRNVEALYSEFAKRGLHVSDAQVGRGKRN